jgi:hypothetical protein
MARARRTILAGILVAIACAVGAAAQSPSNVPLVPQPPGSVVQNRLVYLNGEATNVQWRVIASKNRVGAGNGRQFYQWFLSIYSLRRGAYRLRYQSPANGGPLSRVTQANGAQMWFPVQELRVVGAAELMQTGVQQIVVQSHEMAADCGSATVTAFAGGPGGSVVPAVSVSNPCELAATIASDRKSVVLRGPYYAADAAMCCPTKPSASAVLRYRNGQWIESPNYFKLYVGRLPPA